MSKRFNDLKEMGEVYEAERAKAVAEAKQMEFFMVSQEEYDWYLDRLNLKDTAARRVANKQFGASFRACPLKVNAEPAE